MNAIQVLLIAAMVLWLASYLARVRAQGFARLVAVAAGLAGILLVAFPGLSVRMAKLVGVTRGVDLVIYLSLVAFGFLWLQMVTRVRDLERKLVELSRQLALAAAADRIPNAPAGAGRPSEGGTPRRDDGAV
jgi:hypothetical protein